MTSDPWADLTGAQRHQTRNLLEMLAEPDEQGRLCRCGYEAEDDADLSRHVISWLNYFSESGQDDRALEHVED